MIHKMLRIPVLFVVHLKEHPMLVIVLHAVGTLTVQIYSSQTRANRGVQQDEIPKLT